MIILAALIYLPIKIILAIGLIIVATHNVLGNVTVEGNTLPAFLWALIHKQSSFSSGGRTFFVAYPVIPWVGVMALGNCLGGSDHLWQSNKILKRNGKLIFMV